MAAYIIAIIVLLPIYIAGLVSFKLFLLFLAFGLSIATLTNLLYKPYIEDDKILELFSDDDFVLVNTFCLKKIEPVSSGFGGYAVIGLAEEREVVKVFSDDETGEFKIRYLPIEHVKFIEDNRACDELKLAIKNIYPNRLLSIFPTKVSYVMHYIHVPDVDTCLPRVDFSSKI